MKILTEHSDFDRGSKLIATIGMFDGVHIGHQELIATMRREANLRNLSSAVVTFRQHPQSVLRHNPEFKLIMTCEQRLRALQDTGVEYVILLDFDKKVAALSSEEFMGMLHLHYGVNALIVGFNHRFGHNRQATFDDYADQGTKIGIDIIKAEEFCTSGHHISSSSIRKALLQCNIQEANQMLGKPFSIIGTVVHGEQNGRKIGFPTANIDPQPDIIVPGNGVYAVMVEFQGKRYPGMCNIGNRPTVSDSGKRSIEVNIFNFSQDIYGESVTVEFHALTRHETKFESLEQLKNQLASDKQEILKILN